MEMKMISINKIRPSPFQPRQLFDKEKISELAGSIRENDLIEPIVVRQQGDTYQIIAGERRWRAWHEVERKEIPSIIRNVDDTKAMELSLIENWQRVDLESTERENMVVALWNTGNYKSGAELARTLGVDRTEITTLIKVKDVRDKEGLMTSSSTAQIRQTLTLQPDERKAVLQKIEDGKLQSRDVGEFVKTIKSSSEPIKAALLKPKSKITLETAKKIAEFPKVEQQKVIIKDIEKAKELEEEGIKAYVEDRLDITKGKRDLDITIRDPQKRMVELYGRIYSDVITISAEHVEDLPEIHKQEAIRYMRGARDHLERELIKLGELKVIRG